MSNEFSKEERVAFENMLTAFRDGLVLSNAVNIYTGLSSTEMERSRDTVWRPQRYIMQSFDGQDQTSNFQDSTQLTVPTTLGFSKSVPWKMNALEKRDELQAGRLGIAASEKLASDVNVSVMNVAADQGTLVVKRTVAASGYDDVAECDAIMNEQGIPLSNRCLALGSRDYNGMAGDLAKRGTMAGKPTRAYQESYVGRVASFETLKLDYANRIAAAAGSSLTVDTQTSATNYYTPEATSTSSTGEVSNVDNRRQILTISSTTGVKKGDCFTIAGVEAVHHITKKTTGNLKTFRVLSVPSGTTLEISPPLISNQGNTDAEAQYQNVEVTASATASIVFMNTVAAPINPFFHKDAIDITPGRYAVDADAGAAIMRGKVGPGIELTLQKQYDINTMITKYRADIIWGVTMNQPEMAGLMIFNQT